MIITPDNKNPELLMLVAGGKKILSLLPSELNIVLYYWYRFPREESGTWVNTSENRTEESENWIEESEKWIEESKNWMNSPSWGHNHD